MAREELSDEAIRDATRVGHPHGARGEWEGPDEKVDIYSAGITFCELFEQGTTDVQVAWTSPDEGIHERPPASITDPALT